MTEELKDTMTAQQLCIREEEKKPAPKPVLQAWEVYKEARKEATESRFKRWEGAVSSGEDPDVTRLRRQDALEREVRVRHA